MLTSLGVRLFIRDHYAMRQPNPLEGLSNIEFFPYSDLDPDLTELLSTFDFLITDYSSILFDFLLTDRPIIFAPFDIVEYERDDRGFNFDYEAVTAGRQCRDWQDVGAALREAKEDPRIFARERRELRRLFYPLPPGFACQRVCDLMDVLSTSESR